MQKALQSRSPAITVVVAEANHLNCQLVASAFRPKRAGVSVVASAVASHQALTLFRERQPDVAIVSSELEDGPLEGYRVVRELRILQSKTRAIMLLGTREREPVIDAFRSGAHGVIFRDEAVGTLAKCIHAVNRGQVWASSEHLGYLLDVLGHGVPSRLRDARGMELLSRRETEVVRLVSEGLTNRGISKELGLSEHTIRNYLFRVFDKLGVSTRVELVLYCFQERQARAAGDRRDEPATKPGTNGI